MKDEEKLKVGSLKVEVKDGSTHEITINQWDEPLVTLNPANGDVIIHRDDRLSVAAKIFWAVMKHEGKSMYQRVCELEEKLEKIKSILKE